MEMATNLENALSGIRALLVDSDEPTRLSTRTFFSDITRSFTTIGSAAEAMRLFEDPIWDIVICNLNLPESDGLELCARIKKIKPNIQLILASDAISPSLRNEASAIGASKIIDSPITPEKLISTLIEVTCVIDPRGCSEQDKAEKNNAAVETVSILELDESMLITSFIRFGHRFEKISAETRDWIRHNFNGASAIVNRRGQKLNLTIMEIETGDDIVKIHQLPVSLMKICFVRPSLIKELKKKGFIAFEVTRKPSNASVQQQIRQEAISRTEAFLSKVKDCISVRDQLSDSMKEIFSKDNQVSIDMVDLIGHIEGVAEKGVAEAITAIATLKKSDHLCAHCVDVGAIFLSVYSRWVESGGKSNSFQNNAEMMLSAVLHDIGKIFIPEEIRENAGNVPANGPRIRLERKHPNDGAGLLSSMGLSRVAVNMARYHHVKADTSIKSSYPPLGDYSVVLPETRLLAIVNKFQAIISRRQYKRSWAPAGAMVYMDNLVGIEFDPRAWFAFRDTVGWYPVGSLVELNDGSKAFVVARPDRGLRRPSVVVVRNKNDERLTHNTFLDLNSDKDIYIKKGLDHFEEFGDDAINQFVSLQIA